MNDTAPALTLTSITRVDDLTTTTVWAIGCGATLAEFQPQDDVRVLVDPAGHPFCLFL